MINFERLFSWACKPWVMVGWFMLLIVSFLYIDKPLSTFCYHWGFKSHWPWLKGVTLIGSNILILMLIGLAFIGFRYLFKHKHFEYQAIWLGLCVVIPNAVALVIKVILGRARPEQWFLHQKYGFYGPTLHSNFWSMPSAHTTTVMGLAFGLSLLFPRWRWAFWIIGLLVTCSRILLLKHYLSDVLCATFLTILEVGVLWALIKLTPLSLVISERDRR